MFEKELFPLETAISIYTTNTIGKIESKWAKYVFDFDWSQTTE